jgi:hypothetical protein
MLPFQAKERFSFVLGCFEGHRNWKTTTTISKAPDQEMKEEAQEGVTQFANTVKYVARGVALICHPVVK